MSFLSNLLLGGQGQGQGQAATKDTDLDALFTRTREAEHPAKGSKAKSAVKPPEDIIAAARLAKTRSSNSSSTKRDRNEASKDKSNKRARKPSPAQKQKPAGRDSDDDDDDAVEESYAVKKARQHALTLKSGNKPLAPAVDKGNGNGKGKGKGKAEDNVPATTRDPNEDESEDDSSSGDDQDEDDQVQSELVHETVLQARRAATGDGGSSSTTASKRTNRKPKAPDDESAADKDARTTFLGNVPIACSTSKSARKALIRHLVSTLPADDPDYRALIRIDSIRFRSLPLAAPVPSASGTKQPQAARPSGTTTIDVGDKDDAAGAGEGGDGTESRSRKRARRWRENEVGEDDDDDDGDVGGNAGGGGGGRGRGKPAFLTAAQKRKVAYIKGEVHEKAGACNAYAVWLTADPGAASSAQLAALVVRHGNNSEFQGRTLRVDSVGAGAGAVGRNATSRTPLVGMDGEQGEEDAQAELRKKKEAALEQRQRVEEEKRTLYLGSLDFEESEQAVRELCETLMKEERGDPPPKSKGRGKEYAGPQVWVERVRVVKDPETGLGKGFAYVVFRDIGCVDEMLALDAGRVRLSKRKLRMERCKSSSLTAAVKKMTQKAEKTMQNKAAGGAEKASVQKQRDAREPKSGRSAAPPAGKVSSKPLAPPKPRPDIGESLRELSKDDRRAIKSADENRLRRRLEKKQRTREGLKAQKAKDLLDKKVRKTNAPKSGTAGVGKRNDGKKKSRLRSDNMERKKNSKKADA